MLEIRNVSRIYKPKKGVPVKALDNVSLKFPEKGMVFILGKSGSGKSTLLNILGGLDRADKGEIIIKGKSSKDFTQSDFDSYRNTYLGFVFQEYNILNEFTVGANIGLALELQGKKATNQEINRILEEVDLVGYGNRKPTELSGGQKQRVAIARALVKNPEIILADEPTGALDSKTGIQVFETLKKLSKDKLVIVVTHDREFAEYYGDRVIEFKDGRVISDIEKYVAPSFKKNPYISIVDDKIISIKQGYQLTPEDVKLINDYIKNHNAIISIDERANEDLRKFARIDLEGNKEAFKQTDESKIEISQDKRFKLIKSRLPWKNSIKIGASGLKSKPFRLVMTILLSIVAFTMAGLSDTLGAYNKYKVTTQSYIDSNINAYVLQKQIKVGEDRYSNDINANDEDLRRLKEKTGLTFKGVYNPGRLNFSLGSYAHNTSDGIVVLYDTNAFSGFYEITQDDINQLGFNYWGTLPQSDDKIAISKYMFDFFKKYGYSYESLRIPAAEIINVDDFLNKNPKIYLNNQEFTVSAVIDTEFNYQKFEPLNKTREEMGRDNFINYWFEYELSQTILYGYHGMFFVNDGYIGRMLEGSNHIYVNSGNLYLYPEPSFPLYSVIKQEHIDQDDIIFFNSQKNKLNSNEVILNVRTYIYYLQNALTSYYETIYGDNAYLYVEANTPQWIKEYYAYLNDYVETRYYRDYLLNTYVPNNYPNGFYIEEDFDIFDERQDRWVFVNAEDYTFEKMSELDEDQRHYIYYLYLLFHQNNNPWGATYNEIKDIYIEYVKDTALDNFANGTLSAFADEKGLNDFRMDYNNYNLHRYENRNMKVAGVYLNDNPDLYQSPVIIDDSLYNEISESAGGYYTFLIAPMPSSESEIAKLVKFGYDNSFDGGVSYAMRNGVMTILSQVNSFIETLAKVFLYIGIGFAVFASLLLMNFISISISYKSKEIGILRAIGARSSDVFGIFFNESMIIALINYVLSVIATILGVYWINLALRNEYGILITLLVFGLRQLVLMLAISVGVAFVSSFFPVMRVARKKPVDAMKK